MVGLVILGFWMHSLHGQPARSLIRPYHISERVRLTAIGLLFAAATVGALADWLPYRHLNYDDQWFSAAAGLMSGFFVAWCCVALTLWYRARKSRGAL